MAKNTLIEEKIRFLRVLQELAPIFKKNNSQGKDNVFGITSNPSMYTQWEFWGVIQILVQEKKIQVKN